MPFADCAPYETARSIGTEEDIAQWSGYLHCGFNNAAEAGKDTPYYSPYQKLVFAGMGGITWLYRLVSMGGRVRWIPRRRKAQTDVLWLLLFGLLGMALLRCAMIAFVEVSSFGIGTSTMYLATVHPLLVLYAFVSVAAFGWPKKRKENAA